MEGNYYNEYSLITGESEFGPYISPEKEVNKIKKCTILKSVDVTYSNEIIGYRCPDKKYAYN